MSRRSVADPQGPRFAAFISYRHREPDRRWARWLHAALESYRVPSQLCQQGLPLRVGRVFRDEEEMAASESLSAQIIQALGESSHLIVVCSPRAPESKWVNQEIEEFRRRGREGRVLSLLIEGSPTESFPAALRGLRAGATTAAETAGQAQGDPLAADVRPVHGESARAQRRLALLRLLAPILGCRFDDLRQRDQERQRRSLLRWAAALVCLAVALGGLAAYALHQRELVGEERDRVAASERVARDRLADLREETGRNALVRGNLDRAVHLLAEAYEEEPAHAGRQVLLGEALAHTRGLRRTLDGRAEQIAGLYFSQDGSALLAAPTWGLPLVAWELEGARVATTLKNNLLGVAPGVVTRDGRRGVGLVQEGRTVRARVFSLPEGAPLPFAFGERGDVPFAALAADGQLLLTLVQDRGSPTAPDAIVWDVETGAVRRRIPGPWELGQFSPDSQRLALLGVATSPVLDVSTWVAVSDLGQSAGLPLQLVFAPDGSRCVHAAGGRRRLVDLKSGAALATLPPGPSVTPDPVLSFSPRGRWLLCSGGESGVLLMDGATGAEAARSPEGVQPISCSFGPQEKTLAVHAADGAIHLLDLQQVAWRSIAGPASRSPSAVAVGMPAAFDPQEERILWGTSAGEIHVLQTEDGSSLATWSVLEGLTTAAFHPRGDQVVSAGRDGTLRLWDWREARGEPERVLPVQDGISQVADTDQGRRLYVATHAGRLLSWDASQGGVPRISQPTQGPLLGLVPIAGGLRLLLAPAYTGRLEVLDAETLKSVASLVPTEFDPSERTLVRGMETIWAVAAPRRGRGVSFGSAGVAVWSLDPLEAAKPVQVLPGSERQAVLSPGGTYLLTRSDEGRLRLWREQAGSFVPAQQAGLDGLSWAPFAAFSPDEGRLGLVDAAGSLHLMVLDVPSEPIHLAATRARVTSLTFSPRGTYLATALEDGTIELWDGRSGRWLRTLAVPGERSEDTHAFQVPAFQVGSAAHLVHALRIDERDELLVAGHGDGWAHLWDLETASRTLSWRRGSPVLDVRFAGDGAVALAEANEIRVVPLHRERRSGAEIRRHVAGLSLRAVAR